MKKEMLYTFPLNKWNTLFLLALVLSTFLISCKPATDTHNNVGRMEKIIFCRPTNMASAFVYLAEAQGYFKEEGLDVAFEDVAAGKVGQDALLAGKADFLTGSDGPFTYLNFQEHPLVLIAEIGKNPETAIFVRTDQGIEKPEDLKNKRVAYMPGTILYFYLVRFVEKHHMSMKDLKLVSMQPLAISQAFIGGSVDAMVMIEPYGANALQALGNRAKKFTDPSIYSARSHLITTRKITQNRPDVIKRVIRALLKAETFFHNHPQESIQILSQKIKLDPNLLAEYWNQYDYHLRLNAETIQIMQDHVKYIQRDDPNFTDLPIPNFRASIDERFLKEIDSTRVSLP